jgi:hypothetical protein
MPSESHEHSQKLRARINQLEEGIKSAMMCLTPQTGDKNQQLAWHRLSNALNYESGSAENE